MRLAAAPCFLKLQGASRPWSVDVRPAGGRHRQWRRGVDADLLAALSTFGGAIGKGCAIEAAPHRIRQPDGSRDGIVGNQAFKLAAQALQALPGIARRPHSTEATCASPAPLLHFVAFLAATLSINQNCPYSGLGRILALRILIPPPRALWLNKVAPHYSSSRAPRLTQPD